jgi:hypothetical protein
LFTHKTAELFTSGAYKVMPSGTYMMCLPTLSRN